MRDLLLVFHIIGVAGWLGGGMFFVWSAARLVKSDNAGAGASIATIVSKGAWFFGPVTALILLTGTFLVLDSAAFGWDSMFVWVGIGAIVASGIWQGTLGAKNDERFVAAVTDENSDRARALNTWRRYSLVDFGILGVAIWAMVVKLGA